MFCHSAALKTAVSLVTSIALLTICGEVQAQRRAPVQIGGPNGITMGGGMGFKMGGRNGVHFGGGQGAKFGPPEFGMHFGNGQGARFGSPNFGMQFGGGQGARFGTPENGMQFGHGEGARFGKKGSPLMQFGGRDRLSDPPQSPSAATPTAQPLPNRGGDFVPSVPTPASLDGPKITPPNQTGPVPFSILEKKNTE